MTTDGDTVVVIFSREQVRQLKVTHFLKQLGPPALPSGPQLAAMMGRFQFLVDGWNDDPQELYVIPEVRRFYQHFHKVWPYWFYFCDLRSETLTMMTRCLMPNLSSFKRLGQPLAKVEYNPLDLLPFISRNFVPLNPDRYSINQDAVVKLMAWAGNMTISNRRLQGVLYPT